MVEKDDPLTQRGGTMERTRPIRLFDLLVVLFGWLVVMIPVTEAIEIRPPFNTDYTFADLGNVPGLPSRYGGLTFKLEDPNTILIGGNANVLSGQLFSIGVVRDADKHIIGFTGTATFFADADYNDGGVAYAPGHVLFLARWPVNELGLTKPGSTITDKIIDLDPLGVTPSPGGLNFVPPDFPGEGQLKIVSWSGGEWYTLGFEPDGLGTFNIPSATYATTITGGPEGFIYVPPGSPKFTDYKSMLVSEYSAGTIGAYEIDSNGDPIPGTRLDFITGLEGAEGAAIDPVTGDFLFSTFGGGDRVIVVRGFAPPPCNEKPVAAAGLDQNVSFGASVNLNGSASYDPCPGPEPLNYAWSFISRPTGSTLVDTDIVGGKNALASFFPDVPGRYLLRLTVSDSENTASDDVQIDVGGGPPVADAGPEQHVPTGAVTSLDGSGSFDPGEQLITYLWALVGKPPVSLLTDSDINARTTPDPSFTPDVDGTYRFQLLVSNGLLSSPPDFVEIRAFTGNVPPTARAGKNQNTRVNALVVLDGSASFDADDGPGEMMTFLWHFKQVPAASTLLDKDLIDRDQVSASFIPDISGVYVVELQVSDGLDTDTDEVTIMAYSTNVPPDARAGSDRKTSPGTEVILDGTRSRDPDEGPGPLTYQWRFVFLPPGSSLTNGSIVNSNTASPKFAPDVAGAYVIELTVSDSVDMDFDHVMIIVTTEPWLEVTVQEGTLGTEFTLAGHGLDFGSAKGKLKMGKRYLKAVSWASQSIFIRVKKPNPPATYDITILPKKPKGGTQQVILERNCFTVKVPEVSRVPSLPGGDGYRVVGRFFGNKKGKIYLGDLACKVSTWTMNPVTNESEATFLLPKGITSGTYILSVGNKVGKGKGELTMP